MTQSSPIPSDERIVDAMIQLARRGEITSYDRGGLQ